MKSPNTQVVVGGGISGMLAALLLKRKRPDAHVVLIERANELGGLLRSFDHGENGRFDFGVHTMYETGLPELDRILFNIVPQGGWNRLAGYERDFGGAWFANHLHGNTAYLDLRSLGRDAHLAYVASFFSEARWKSGELPAGFMDFFTQRYGASIAANVLAPIIPKFTGVAAAQSHRLAGRVVPMERLALLDEDTMASLMEAPDLRARIAYPDQRTLPEKWVPNRVAYYPKAYGMYRYVDAFKQVLLDHGVEIWLGAKISGLTENTLAVEGREPLKFDALTWTIHPAGLAALLGIATDDLAGDPPRTTVIASYWLHREPNCKGLYYAFSYDPAMRTHRFSCPHYFCPESTVNGRYRLISELVGGHEGAQTNWAQVATDELKAMGIFDDADVSFVKAEVIPGGYPSLSTRNVQNIAETRGRIAALASDSIQFLGILAEDDLFFQTDIMAHIFRKLG